MPQDAQRQRVPQGQQLGRRGRVAWGGLGGRGAAREHGRQHALDRASFA